MLLADPSLSDAALKREMNPVSACPPLPSSLSLSLHYTLAHSRTERAGQREGEREGGREGGEERERADVAGSSVVV